MKDLKSRSPLERPDVGALFQDLTRPTLDGGAKDFSPLSERSGFILLGRLAELGCGIYNPSLLAEASGTSKQVINNWIARGHLVTVTWSGLRSSYRYVVLDAADDVAADVPTSAGDRDPDGYHTPELPLQEPEGACPAESSAAAHDLRVRLLQVLQGHIDAVHAASTPEPPAVAGDPRWSLCREEDDCPHWQACSEQPRGPEAVCFQEAEARKTATPAREYPVVDHVLTDWTEKTFPAVPDERVAWCPEVLHTFCSGCPLATFPHPLVRRDASGHAYSKLCTLMAVKTGLLTLDEVITTRLGGREESENEYTAAEKLIAKLVSIPTKRGVVKVQQVGSDPNDHGVYTDYESVTIPVPKSAKVHMVIRLAQGRDGKWRGGFDYRLGSTETGSGGGSCAPSDTWFGVMDTRGEALAAVCRSMSRLLLTREGKWRVAARKAMNAFMEAEGIAADDEEHPTPQLLSVKRLLNEYGFSRDEAKLLCAGYTLVRYIRQEKRLETVTPVTLTWHSTIPFESYPAAERRLKEKLSGEMTVEVNADGHVERGQEKLSRAGFAFYRFDETGCRIKCGPNWKTWKKFPSRQELVDAWDELRKEDLKALVG